MSALQGIYVSEGFNWVADANHLSGDVKVFGADLVGIVAVDVASGKSVGVRFDGIFEVVKTNENMPTAYVPVYWDDNANPYGGVAGTGAAVLSSWLGPFMGYILETAGTTDGRVRIKLMSAPPGSGS